MTKLVELEDNGEKNEVGGGAKRPFKFQAKSCEVSVQIYVCLSVFPSLDKIAKG